jgi:DNA repair protein RadC
MENGRPIRLLADDERPREKLWASGPTALSNAELLALLIGSGDRERNAVDLGREVLDRYGQDLTALSRCAPVDLARFAGIGPAKAARLSAALELGRRRLAAAPAVRPQIRCSRDLYLQIRDALAGLEREEFWVLYCNRANRLLHRERISVGGVSGTVVDVKIVFKAALERLASSVALCHNHPSGNLRPSEADRHLTRKVVQAGRVLDVHVMDHLILTDGGYFSFADEGLLQG